MGDSTDYYLKSTFYEQLVEHVFVSEVLQEAFHNFDKTVEVLRSEIDASGYDVVFECDGVLRHVQLKTSTSESKVRLQKINRALEAKPGGCVVWIVRGVNNARIHATHYLYFGGPAGSPLPSLENFKTAKHTKANAQGVKLERPAIRIVPIKHFKKLDTTTELVKVLFGLPEPKRDRSARI